MLTGNILSSFTMRLCGRKMNLLFSFVPTLIGWIYITFAIDYPMLLVSCLLIGFGSGVNVPVGLVYYAETCAPKVRGLLLGAMVSSVSIGIALVHTFGIFLDWKMASKVCTALPILGFCWTLFVPESPAWLLSQQRMEKAKENFIWLRGFDAASQAEFNTLLSRQEGRKSSWRQFWRSLVSMQFFRPFFMLILLFTVQQWSGLNVIVFHSIFLLKKISAQIDEESCTIFIDLLRIASSLLGCYLLRILKRRILYFISAAGTVVSMVAIAVISEYNLSGTFSVIAMGCYIFALHSGVVTLPWLMNSEVRKISGGL